MKVRTAALILTLVLGLLTVPLPAEAQEAGKVYRIGVLSHTVGCKHLPRHYAVPPFMQTLRDLGWVDGKNLVIEYRCAEGNYGRMSELAADLVLLRVDVIVAFQNPAILAAKQATASIPIIMAFAQDPIGSGLVPSLARPGGNVTGTTVHRPELAGKMIEVLKDTLPNVRRVALLWEADFSGMPAYEKEAEAAARALSISLERLPVRKLADVDAALARIREHKPDAALVVPTGLIWLRREEIFDFLARIKLPAMYPSRTYVEAGGLMSYGYDFYELIRQTAAFVDKIFKGANPANLPVEQPMRHDLVINMKTAKALGLTIPPSVLIRADKVIE